jgi:Domain of unknown function (DUF4282)
MAGHAASQGRPDSQGRDAYASGYYSPGATGAGFDPPTTAMPASGVRHSPRGGVGTKGFLASLFDFGFTSFVTPKVIKVLYLLIMIGAVVSSLFYSFLAYTANPALGILTLLVIAPLYTVIVLAIWRIALEFFMVIFRISDDIRSVRERGEFR